MRRVAAIDIGTNTVRLLVADDGGAGPPRHVRRGQRITRLGSGVDAAGRLDDGAMVRTVRAVADFAAEGRAAAADVIRVIGTSALRDAADRERFADAVAAAADVRLEILPGAEEAALSFAGATCWLEGRDVRVVCDIGGGSTELTRGSGRPEVAASIDVGSVRLRERFLPSDPPTDEEVGRARAYASEALRDGAPPVDGTETLVGVAGTVTTLSAVVQGLGSYDSERVHGFRLTSDAVADWTDRLCRMAVEEVRALGPVQPGRADVLVAGAIILREVLALGGWRALLVSERDILDGLVMSARRASGDGGRLA